MKYLLVLCLVVLSGCAAREYTQQDYTALGLTDSFKQYDYAFAGGHKIDVLALNCHGKPKM